MDEDHIDKLTEARSSYEKESWPKKIYHTLCPCLVMQPLVEEKYSQTFSMKNQQTKGNIQPNEPHDYNFAMEGKKDSMQTDAGTNIGARQNRRKASEMSISAHERVNRYNYEEGPSFLIKSTIQKWHSYPIYEHVENKLIFIGSYKAKLIAKVSSVRIDSSAAVKKKTAKSRSQERSPEIYNSSSVDTYWADRYYLFEKFDEGISLDEESWYQIVPQAVAEYIASKIRCQTVLDAFCGAGANSIKLSNTCSRVIASDSSLYKLKCLLNNSKVYCTENIDIQNQSFITMQGVEPDIILLSPVWKNPEILTLSSTNPEDFNPPLSKIIAKSILLAQNFVMVLPANIDILKLSQIIAEQHMKAMIPAATCSIKIEKIFFMSKLKHVLVFFGTQVQSEIKLNDELSEVYKLLKQNEKKHFMHIKIVKHIREKYGMISLLNFVFESEKIEKGSKIQKFYSYVREKNLLPADKLDKIIKEQMEENEKCSRKKIPLIHDEMDHEVCHSEEEKYVEEEDQGLDRTVSYYSTNSGVNRMSVEPRECEQLQGEIENVTRSDIRRKQTLQFCAFEKEVEEIDTRKSAGDKI